MTNASKFAVIRPPDRDRIPVVDFDPVLADEVLAGMMNGELLFEICSEKYMPLPATVRRWAVEDSEFGDRFSRAIEMQAHMLFEEGVCVARNATKDENQTRNKNHVDACFKAAGKLLPKVYGDKADAVTIIPIQVVTNLGDGQGVTGVGQGVYTVEIADKVETSDA